MLYPFNDKRICALLLIISNIVQNVNLRVALHSELRQYACSYYLNVVQYASCQFVLWLIISKVVQNV